MNAERLAEQADAVFEHVVGNPFREAPPQHNPTRKQFRRAQLVHAGADDALAYLLMFANSHLKGTDFLTPVILLLLVKAMIHVGRSTYMNFTDRN